VGLGLDIGEVGEEVLNFFGYGAEDEDGFHGKWVSLFDL
jgi:hypothetical protein